MRVTLNQLFDQIHNVPQIPEVVHTLITQFNNPKVNFNVIAKNIEKEQVISMKVLRLVNSAHFGLSKKIGTIQEAVVMLGMDQLRTLVIASAMTSAVPVIEGVNIKEFWSDSFQTATYAKRLAIETGQMPDLAFTAGLISGLGHLLIHMGASSAANEIDQHVKSGHERSEIEMNRLGFTSEDVCAELCRRWHFSSELVDAVAHSGAPLTSGDVVNLPACVITIARFMSHSQRAGVVFDDILNNFPYAVAEQLGLTKAFVAEKLLTILALESGLDGLID